MSDLSDVTRDARIKTLETDVTALKVDVSTIGVQINTMEGLAKERHGILSTQQIRMMDLLEEREKDAREYRVRREEIETKAQIAHQQWLKSLVNPQTIVIIIAVVLSLFGTRVADIQQVASIMGTPIPVQLPAPPQELPQELPAQ
jgi:hypothetical protein